MYSRTLKEIPTYDLPKTASPLERIFLCEFCIFLILLFAEPLEVQDPRSKDLLTNAYFQ